MQLTVVLFLCVTSFVCVRGRQHGDSVLLKISKHQTTACGNKLKSIHQMSYTCIKPHRKLVTLRATSGTVSILPQQIYLKRCDCDHTCRNGGQCVSKKQEIKKHWIAVTFGSSTSQKCLEVDLPEDTDCQCRCTKTAADCNEEMQQFDSASCSCVCKDAQKYKDECIRKGFGWSNETCMCECPNKMKRCSTGSTWCLNDCKCVKVAPETAVDGKSEVLMKQNYADWKYREQS